MESVCLAIIDVMLYLLLTWAIYMLTLGDQISVIYHSPSSSVVLWYVVTYSGLSRYVVLDYKPRPINTYILIIDYFSPLFVIAI
jgi:hypothetical protein